MSTGTKQAVLQRQGSGGSTGGGGGGTIVRSGSANSRLGAAMRAARRRAAGPQALLTEHVENLWLNGYRCEIRHSPSPGASSGLPFRKPLVQLCLLHDTPLRGRPAPRGLSAGACSPLHYTPRGQLRPHGWKLYA